MPLRMAHNLKLIVCFQNFPFNRYFQTVVHWVMETMDKGTILDSKVLPRLQLSLRAVTHPLSLCLHIKFTIGINACYVSKRKTMFYPSSGFGHRNSTTVRTLFLSCGLLLMSWLNVPQAANLYYLFLLSQPNNWILV